MNAAAAPAAATPVDARTRLPHEPYPGLRPFLSFEAALLFGRERQVREVIERLQQTQFVAVLGGSGSGKSSLIHAGVVPELRSFGIPGAGDLWLPLTCTPGTNVSAADSATRRHSPVVRLARRFAGLLRSRGSAEADAARVQEIAAVFRQEAGFARLLDTYAAELAVPPGPDPAEARVLFVVDQFEEIFHPTNAGVEDASLLVERVLDHFFNPHPRCYVVLTMRSEHLNDCASFLELPDAINKSSFLVRRLDDDELRDAITGPAQRFLRLMARTSPDDAAAPPLPAEVVFEPAVLERLLRDVKAISHDPDHLPLLQHLLARLWQAAVEREGNGSKVPARVTADDLVRAVHAGAPADGPPLDDGRNVLRASVENWPESIYQRHGSAQRGQLECVFRRLAFKDPNTGLYSQQRIDVDVGARLLGAQATRADLRALVGEGFLGAVDYLFWDDEDADRVMLKVSHESFIRGWSRFREWIDDASERFDAYMGMLRKCAAWVASGRSEDFLLETGEMRRLHEGTLQATLADAVERAEWRRFLLLDRDATRLAAIESELDSFLATSGQRLRDRERREGRSRRNWLMLGALTLLLLPSALFSLLIQGPVTQRAELLFDAGNRANRAPLTPDYPAVGAAAGPLDSLLRAGALIDEARSGQGFMLGRVSEWLLEQFAWIPPVRRQDAFLAGVTAQTEPPVNGKLRQLLSSTVWVGDPARSSAPLAPVPPAARTCRPVDRDSGREALAGLLLTAAPATVEPGGAPRVLFVAEPADGGLSISAARDDGEACVFGPSLLTIPPYLRPHVVFDAGLNDFAYTAGSDDAPGPVTVHEIDWIGVDGTGLWKAQSQTRTVITGSDAFKQVNAAVGSGGVGVVPMRPSVGGRTLQFASGPAWRVLATSAVPLAAAVAADPEANGFAPLRRAEAGSSCRALLVAADRRVLTQMLEGPRHCFSITAEAEDATPAPRVAMRALAPTERRRVLVAVYRRPDLDVARGFERSAPAPIASLPLFTRASIEAVASAPWLVGVDGEHAGWLALRLPAAQAGGAPAIVAAPWSTCALWRLGTRELQPSNPPPAVDSDAMAVDATGGAQPAAPGAQPRAGVRLRGAPPCESG